MEPARGMGIRELDLSASHSNTLTNKINAVPGLRTSAAFFAFLRANLVLDQNALSTCSTPILQPCVRASPTDPPSPSLTASSSLSTTSQSDSLLSIEDIPPLNLASLISEAEKKQSIRLISDSINQMRWIASRSLFLHPVSLAGLITTLSAIHSLTKDPRMAFTLSCATLLLWGQAIRFSTAGYSAQAQQLSTRFFRQGQSGDDIVLGARQGDEIAATVVLRLEVLANPSARRKHNRTASLQGGKGIIRAWTTRRDLRGTGIGRDMLLEAVKMTKERCGKDAKVGFAKEHANSVMLLPSLFNGHFRTTEVKASKALDSVLAEWDHCKKRR